MAISETLARKRLQVTGVVQGVGFRPFIYRLARRHHLAGWVCNTSQCVEIEIEGPPASVATFIGELQQEAPALARIEAVVSQRHPAYGQRRLYHSGEPASGGHPGPDPRGRGHLRRLSGRHHRPPKPPLPVSFYQLHQLRPPVHHHPAGAL